MTESPPRLKRPGLTVIEVVVVLALLWFIFFRVLSVVLLLATLALYLLFPLHRNRRCIIASYFIALVSFFSPIDIDVGGLYQHGCLGMHFGERRSGPRLIRLVMGMPRTTYLKAKYGEFISGGCVVRGTEPKWILVWN